MEFDHLKGFYYAAKLSSFTEAASRLYVTQPAISLQVKALEKEIGERLFDRVGRTIRLTAAGKILYRHVGELIAKLNEIQRTVDGLKNLDRGQLYLGASDTTSMYFLPGLLKTFRAAHPNVDVHITSMISTEVMKKVMDREVDLGIVTLREPPAGLAAIPLFRQKLVCIASSNHELSSRKLVRAGDLAEYPLILLEKQSLTRKETDSYLRKAGLAKTPVFELSNFEIIKSYVAAGLGVSLTPEAAVAGKPKGICSVPLHRPPTFEVGLVHRKDREFSNPAKAFLRMAREFFRKPADRSRKAPATNVN